MLETHSMCWRTPTRVTVPCDRSRASALYPCSSMAPEYLSGSTLRLLSSACCELMTINTISATLPTSNTEYTSFLSISLKIYLYRLELMLLEPAFGPMKAWNGDPVSISSSAFTSASPSFACSFICFLVMPAFLSVSM